MKSLTVVCPAYNEAAVIDLFYAELKKVIDSIAPRYLARILFVVERSEDGTLECCRRMAEQDHRVSVVALSSRFGHQLALRAGLDHCDADAVVTMDSDLQHPPALIPRMLEEYEKGNDIVYTVREDTGDTPVLKRLTSKLFYWLINRISSVPIQESASDFRLISRRVLIEFQKNIREHNPFFRGLMSWVGFNKSGIAFYVQPRAGGQSKYSLWRMATFAIDGIMSFSKRPLIAAAGMGFLMASYGFLYAVLITIDYFRHRNLVSGWATIVVLVTVLSGTQLICLGILGAYIGAIFDEVKGRPHYIVDEAINLNPRPAPPRHDSRAGG